MNEQEMLSRMKSPRDKRECWRGGVVQIHIIRSCDKSCFHCTQISNIRGKAAIMTPGQFRVAVETLRDHFGVTGIFGGNPCMHPQFEEICAILREAIPFERRGLWSNNPMGKGRICRETFNPLVSNLNVHLDAAAHAEFLRDWPETEGTINLKGLQEDSRHGPPFVAMADVGYTDEQINENAATCDVNQKWSSLIGVFRGELRAYFCELAYAQAALHAEDPDWPDTGMPVVPRWWDHSMEHFAEQVRFHCRRCGMPIKAEGQLAIGGEREQVSETHAAWYRPKTPGRPVELVTSIDQLGAGRVPSATSYLPIVP